MKKLLLNLTFVLTAACFTTSLSAQTNGTLTFTFTPVAHSPCYTGSRNVLAVWIETSSGAFVKTKLRYCCAGSTFDHLPTWSVNAGGTASNCTNANKTDATTGATLASWTTKSFTWDGKNVNGLSNGTTVADGTYKVMIQETWNHGGTGTATTSYTFTKGPAIDHQTPANTTNITGVTLDWTPSGVGIEESVAQDPEIKVYPNPSNDGIFNVEFKKANNIQVVNMLGAVVYEEKINDGAITKSVDISTLSNGIYFIYVFDEGRSSRHKVILNKL